MDPHAFDRLARAFSQSASRRRALGGLLGGALVAGVAEASAKSPGRHRHRQTRDRCVPNHACAAFCAQVFGAGTSGAQQCTEDADHFCRGLCFDCGPAAPPNNGKTLCGQVCCTAPQTCGGGGKSGVCGCTPQCTGQCGGEQDGCGGRCPAITCPSCQTCHAGQCVADASQNRTTCAGSAGAASVCCNGACCHGCCDRDGACGPCRVFTTSQRYDGKLGGLSGADATCQQLAGSVNPPLPGTYQAWLSDSARSPSTRFRCTQANCSARGYVLVDGVTVVATDWTDLTTCSGDGPLGPGTTDCLDHAIDHTETGGLLGSENNVWTYTNKDGTAGGIGNGNCLDWSTNDSSQRGSGGLPVAGHGDITWTRFKDSSAPCNTVGFRLYCFQQS